MREPGIYRIRGKVENSKVEAWLVVTVLAADQITKVNDLAITVEQGARFTLPVAVPAEMRSGLGIDVPILLCTSGKAGHPVHPTPEQLANTDVVLNPADMWRLSGRLGSDVTTRIFPGAVHDISLSRREVREDYLRTAVEWVAGQAGS